MSRPPKSLRLPDALFDRVEAIAKAQGISISAAMRIALQRGVSAMEQETSVPTVRRKVYSRGVE